MVGMILPFEPILSQRFGLDILTPSNTRSIKMNGTPASFLKVIDNPNPFLKESVFCFNNLDA